MIKCKKRKGIISMSVALIITCVIAVALLILVIASKTMNVLIGLITTIAGIAGYFWMGSPESWMTQLRIAIEFQIEPSQIRIYCLAAVIIGVVLLIMGVMRGNKKKEKIVVVQNQAPVINEKEEAKAKKVEKEIKEESKVEKVKKEIKEEPKAKETKKEEAKKEEAKKEEAKVQKVKKEEVKEIENKAEEVVEKAKQEETKAE